MLTSAHIFLEVEHGDSLPVTAGGLEFLRRKRTEIVPTIYVRTVYTILKPAPGPPAGPQIPHSPHPHAQPTFNVATSPT